MKDKLLIIALKKKLNIDSDSENILIDAFRRRYPAKIELREKISKILLFSAEYEEMEEMIKEIESL